MHDSVDAVVEIHDVVYAVVEVYNSVDAVVEMHDAVDKLIEMHGVDSLEDDAAEVDETEFVGVVVVVSVTKEAAVVVEVLFEGAKTGSVTDRSKIEEVKDEEQL